MVRTLYINPKNDPQYDIEPQKRKPPELSTYLQITRVVIHPDTRPQSPNPPFPLSPNNTTPTTTSQQTNKRHRPQHARPKYPPQNLRSHTKHAKTSTLTSHPTTISIFKPRPPIPSHTSLAKGQSEDYNTARGGGNGTETT